VDALRLELMRLEDHQPVERSPRDFSWAV